MPRKEVSKTPSPQPSSILTYKPIFLIFFISHLLAALYSPIQDCDEVYNYWEPTHFLNHGYGLQTWEYSPQYGIRSWAYILPHAFIIGVAKRLLPIYGSIVTGDGSLVNTKPSEFIILRITLGAVCALCERRLFDVLARVLNIRVAWLFLLVCVSSTGFFHASVAYLPSSFAMYTTMLGMAAFMDHDKNEYAATAEGIFGFSIGGILGWPFAYALAVPYVVERLISMLFARQYRAMLVSLFNGALSSFVVLVIEITIDSTFYQKLVCAPLNIVLYNVLNSSEKGSQMFGTEKWYFYIQNLLLNFSLWLPFALLAMPLVIIQKFVKKKNICNLETAREAIFVTPLYLWLAIFTAQPHKEERFMYPAYPALAANAAISLHNLLTFIGSASQKSSVGRVPVKLRLLMSAGFLALAVAGGFVRTFGIITAYKAPLKVFVPLQNYNESSLQNTSICFGKEWYRFPSSYFLPHGAKAKFIKSDFTGLLPGEFGETGNGPFPFSSTSLIPSGMNDQNLEDPGKYIDIQNCGFLVDSHVEGATGSELEPNFVTDDENWERLSCQPFLDPSRTSKIGRLIWIPNWRIIPEKFRRRWAAYCLLRRKQGSQLRGNDIG